MLSADEAGADVSKAEDVRNSAQPSGGGWWAWKLTWYAWRRPGAPATPPGTVRAVELAGEERAYLLTEGRVVDVVVHGIEPCMRSPGKVWINYRDLAGVPGAVLVDGHALIALRGSPPG